MMFFWLDLEKCCFLDNFVIFYEDHLSVARKLGTRDVRLGRTNELFLLHSVKVRRGARSGTHFGDVSEGVLMTRKAHVPAPKLL